MSLTALVGHTGFVGSNLLSQAHFDECYNSKNIQQIQGKSFDLLVCAGVYAEKWKANQNPEMDRQNISLLLQPLEKVRAKKFLLISTVDVYKNPVGVSEKDKVVTEGLHPYGLHRYQVEEWAYQHFPDCLVVRLPGLFGKGLKKNFIYDMIHNNLLHLTDHRSQFQFYDLKDLWQHILIAQKQGLKLVHFATEPVSVQEVARQGFGIDFSNTTEKAPVYYDLKTIHHDLYHGAGNYLYRKPEVLARIKSFVQGERK